VFACLLEKPQQLPLSISHQTCKVWTVVIVLATLIQKGL